MLMLSRYFTQTLFPSYRLALRASSSSQITAVDTTDDIQKILEQAKELEDLGKGGEAVEKFIDVINKQPTCKEAYLGAWNIWMNSSMLRGVPPGKLEWFFDRYHQYIEPPKALEDVIKDMEERQRVRLGSGS